jgi:RNase P subunit RPR2
MAITETQWITIKINTNCFSCMKPLTVGDRAYYIVKPDLKMILCETCGQEPYRKDKEAKRKEREAKQTWLFPEYDRT